MNNLFLERLLEAQGEIANVTDTLKPLIADSETQQMWEELREKHSKVETGLINLVKQGNDISLSQFLDLVNIYEESGVTAKLKKDLEKAVRQEKEGKEGTNRINLKGEKEIEMQ